MTTKISYSFFGLIVGALLGCLVGIGELSQTKKSMRSHAFPILLAVGGLLGSAIGAFVGYKIGLSKHIEEITGIESANTSYEKNGRFWTATTHWQDRRSNNSINLTTSQSEQKVLVTHLNQKLVFIHDTTSASHVTVEKYHKEAVQTIFSMIKSSFDEEFPIDLAKIYPVKTLV